MDDGHEDRSICTTGAVIVWVLIHTGWSKHWRADQYFEDHPFLTRAAAEYLRDAGVTLVGIDSTAIHEKCGLITKIFSPACFGKTFDRITKHGPWHRGMMCFQERFLDGSTAHCHDARRCVLPQSKSARRCNRAGNGRLPKSIVDRRTRAAASIISRRRRLLLEEDGEI